MSGITVALIARNEERFIQQCLQSVHAIADDIVVIDTGSDDNTISIAQREGARVFSRPWPKDFARARNWALEEVKTPWTLMLDADEVLLADDIPNLLAGVTQPTADAYNLRIVSLTDRAEDLSEARVTRLFRTDPRIRWEGRIHEQIIPSIGRAGFNLGPLDVRLMHYGYLNEVMTSRDKLQRNLDLLDLSIKERGTSDWKAYMLWQRAQTLMALQRLDDAAKDMKQAIALMHPTAPLQPLFWLTLAKVYTVKKDFRKVHQTIREGLRLFPDYTDFVYWEGMVYINEGNWDRAWESFQHALQLGVPKAYLQSELGVGTFKALWQMARVSRMQGKMTQAEAYYLKTIQMKTAFYPALHEYIEMLSATEPQAILQRLCLVLSPRALAGALQMVFHRTPLEENLLRLCQEQVKTSAV
ncbi:hypothetical protein BXT84_14735 [Sulfobacillus thermotolerans]|uniref:Glycosyltransferase 2-like domain-containing protein n=1 Tax=Sulfobacillus thermotolerans TaxID=338644 RepID=A0ABN5H303_9FIRM|nr:hypothetical protein BXT84_14735 [Sulfobacillus thermotolerans]